MIATQPVERHADRYWDQALFVIYIGYLDVNVGNVVYKFKNDAEMSGIVDWRWVILG